MATTSEILSIKERTVNQYEYEDQERLLLIGIYSRVQVSQRGIYVFHL